MQKINYKEFYGQDIPSYQDYTDSPTVSVFFYERKKLFLKEFKKIKKRKGNVRVLDVGSGWGSSIFSLINSSDKRDCFLGIDINPNFIKYSKNHQINEKLGKFDFKKINLSKKDWADDVHGEFDMILFSEVIEHLYSKDQDNALKNISKKLSRDGILIITCPNRNCLVKRIINSVKKMPYFGKKIKTELLGSPGHVAELSYPELRKKISRYFYKIKQGGLTFTYGHDSLDRNNFLIILVIFSNVIFRNFMPFWCFDQYIIVKKKHS